MKRPAIITGVGFAFTVALLVAAAWWMLTPWFSYHVAFRVTLGLAVLAHLAYHLHLHKSKVGRLTLASVNLAAVLCLIWAPITLPATVLLPTALTSLNRSLLHHRTITALALDGALSVMSLLFAAHLLRSSGSVPVALWGFFLVQSIWVMIPERGAAPAGIEPEGVDPFIRSRRQAEAALEQLSRQ